MGGVTWALSSQVIGLGSISPMHSCVIWELGGKKEGKGERKERRKREGKEGKRRKEERKGRKERGKRNYGQFHELLIMST